MNVLLHRNVLRDVYEITFFRRSGPGQVDVLQDGEWKRQSEFEAVDEPSMILRPDALEALLREAGKVFQSADATIEALHDTRAVRDRLLALVEQGWAQ